MRHPDKGGSNEAFQKLHNAYCRLIVNIKNKDDEVDGNTDDDIEKDFFMKNNFPKEFQSCFVVILENELANQWKFTLRNMYAPAKNLDNGGTLFKTEGISISLYKKPKNDNRTIKT